MSFNPMDLLKNTEAIQARVKEMEKELQALTVIGEAGGGLVKITLNGQFECLLIELDPVVVDNRDISTLQTLIKSAHHAAATKIQNEIKNRAISSPLGDLKGIFGG